MLTYVRVAKRFGELIAACDYSTAHRLLTPEAQLTHSPDAFRESVESMTLYGQGPILEAKVMEEYILDDWPDKQADDVAIAYVALTGDAFNEAVIVTLVQDGDDFRIRHLEWGRP